MATTKKATTPVAPKTVGATNSQEVKQKVSDVKFFGNPDLFVCLSKASSEEQGWMKSTKAMQTHGGCVIQVSTQQRNEDGSYAVAEAITFVPGVVIKKDSEGNSFLGI